MYMRKAVALALDEHAGAIVTAPISKERWIDAGNSYMGHTDFLVRSANVDKWAMFFWSESMKVALFTTHIPLRKVFAEITKEKISKFCRFIDSARIKNCVPQTFFCILW